MEKGYHVEPPRAVQAPCTSSEQQLGGRAHLPGNLPQVVPEAGLGAVQHGRPGLCLRPTVLALWVLSITAASAVTALR